MIIRSRARTAGYNVIIVNLPDFLGAHAWLERRTDKPLLMPSRNLRLKAHDYLICLRGSLLYLSESGFSAISLIIAELKNYLVNVLNLVCKSLINPHSS
jgi:hypothetical protein